MLKKLFFLSILSLCLFSCSSDEEASMEQICKSELIGKWRLYEIEHITSFVPDATSGTTEIPKHESTVTFTSNTIKRETGETCVLLNYEIKEFNQSGAKKSYILIEKSDIGTEEHDWKIEDGILTMHYYGCFTWLIYKYKKVK